MYCYGIFSKRLSLLFIISLLTSSYIALWSKYEILVSHLVLHSPLPNLRLMYLLNKSPLFCLLHYCFNCHCHPPLQLVSKEVVRDSVPKYYFDYITPLTIIQLLLIEFNHLHDLTHIFLFSLTSYVSWDFFFFVCNSHEEIISFNDIPLCF